MNTDIRIKTSFPNHPKTKKLIKKIGPTGGWMLMKLWVFTAQNKPTGLLTNMNSADISDVMEFRGNPRVMIMALLDCTSGADTLKSCPGCDVCEKAKTQKRSGWLDKTSSGFFQIHDWEEHNPYASKAPERTERAKKGASVRWDNKTKQILDGCSKHKEAMLQAQDSNAILKTSNAPAPAPAPSPIEGAAYSGSKKNGNGSGKSVDAMGRVLKVFS